MTHPQIKSNIYQLIALFLLMLVLVISICFLACVPPVGKDALVHHLAVPKMWLGHGGMYEIPSLEYSYYPMNLDLLYIIPLYFGNDIVPKFIHFSFALATAGLIFGYLKNRLNRSFAMLGALFFLSIPVIVKLSTTVYVDLGLVFFTTAGILSVFKWRDSNFRIRYLIIAGLCCGLGCGTKYNGLIVLLLLFALVAITVSQAISKGRFSVSQAGFVLLLFIALVGIVYAPWGIRNIFWTGNPVFPLFDSLFNGQEHYDIQSIPPLVLRKLMYKETWWETALVPLRIFFQGQDDSHQYFDGKLNPALLLLPLAAFIMVGNDKNSRPYKFEKTHMLLFSTVFVLVVFFQTNMRVRYMAPTIPFLVILTIFGLRNIELFITRYLGRKGRYVVSGFISMAVVLMLSSNAIYIVQQYKVVAPFQYLCGDISRDRYIEKFRPEYAVISHANMSVPRSSVILALFIGRRGYYSNREMLFDIDMLHACLKEADTEAELQACLSDRGLTHLLLRFDMFEQWAQNNLKNTEMQVLYKFLNVEKRLLFSKYGHGIFNIELSGLADNDN